MRLVLLLAVTLLGTSVATASPAPRTTVSLSTLLDVSQLRSTTTRQVLVMPVAATPTTLQQLELRITRPAATPLLKGERRCRNRAAK